MQMGKPQVKFSTPNKQGEILDKAPEKLDGYIICIFNNQTHASNTLFCNTIRHCSCLPQIMRKHNLKDLKKILLCSFQPNTPPFFKDFSSYSFYWILNETHSKVLSAFLSNKNMGPHAYKLETSWNFTFPKLMTLQCFFHDIKSQIRTKIPKYVF